ncbi:MAG: plastocyanin/azurin family copper-binding protein [Dehalococcoidia bacterium]
MKSRWSRFMLLFALGALSLGLLAACSSSDEEDAEEETTATAEATEEGEGEGEEAAAGAITVEATEFAFALGADKAAAGEVTFTLNNAGAIPHELVVVKTDEAADALPVEGGVVVEDEVEVLGRTSQIAGGASEDLTLTLEAGNYVLICNIPAHYETGMHAAFTVE